METNFNDYCKNINLSQVQIERVDKIINEYKSILDEEIINIFIGDQISSDNSRMYLSLFLFSESYIGEAKGFLSEDDFDYIVIKHKITYFHINKNDYAFGEKPIPTSSLTISISIGVVSGLGLSCTFKASGDNCTFLENIFIKHLQPNTINKSSA